MTDSSILYAGIVCFSLIILGFVLTVREFSKIGKTAPAGKHSPQVSYKA